MPDTEAGEKGPGGGGQAVEEALGRYLPVLTAGMRPAEKEKAGQTVRSLFTLRASRGTPKEFGQEVQAMITQAQGLSLDARRRILEEDGLTVEVALLGRRIGDTAALVLRGETRATPEMKKEIRRASARLGQLNAVLVGRFPHLTPLLEEVSESYLDAMYILGDGKGIMSVRLRKAGLAKGSAAVPGEEGPPQRLSPPRPTSSRMTEKHVREIRCPRCGWWWHHPKEPVHFASWDEWGEDHPEKENLTCPNCGEVTEVSEGNVRFSGIEKGRKKGTGTKKN